MMRVSAGIVRREDGRILICQRGEGRHNAHLWEFPGGKQEAGEDAAQCLARELREELSLPITDIHARCQREAEGILFTFLTARTAHRPTLTEHEACAFVQPRELLNYAFCPADRDVARQLALSEPRVTELFWDFDGTLMDTYPAMAAAMVRAAASLGIALDDSRSMALMKRSLPECADILAREHGLSAQAILRRYHEEAVLHPGDVSPMPGIPETLDALHRAGCRHYLATHRPEADTMALLAGSGLAACFEGVVCPQQGFPRKPEPDMLLHLMARFHLPPEQCMMIGDRPLDVQAGQRAGILSCLLDGENRFPDTPCSLRAASARELPGLLFPGCW
ncbi:MAG: HAD-IA family hydrolase [Aristaeellaceae bacterium]